jgi:hypothetical protein
LVRLLRQLSAVYLVAAGLYSCIIVLNARPDLARDLRGLASEATQQGGEFAITAADWTKTEAIALADRISVWAREERVRLAKSQQQQTKPVEVASAPPVKSVPVIVRPLLAPEQKLALTRIPEPVIPRRFALKLTQLPEVATPEFAQAKPQPVIAAPKLEPLQPQEPEAAPDEAPPSAGEVARVAERLRSNLTGELYSNFDLFLYVSKAERGPWAQRMYVLDKKSSGDLALLHAWPVSTGRPARALTKAGLRYALDTPAGYYQLDPNRFHAHYTSAEWGMPMPYAMFFDWVKNGAQTGLAIHGVTGEDIAMLGQRASAGCIRLAPDNAKALFNLIRAKYKGPVPRFAFDAKTGTMSNDGILLHDRNGHLRETDGYRVLVFIENYGGENVVAALY